MTHPAFLVRDVRIGEDPDLPQADTMVELPNEPLAIAPIGREHLDQLVDPALEPFLGQVQDRDDDDDITIVSGTAVAFVGSLPHVPMSRIWAGVAVEISDRKRAKFEVEVLNRDRPFAKFVLVDFANPPAEPASPSRASPRAVS